MAPIPTFPRQSRGMEHYTPSPATQSWGKVGMGARRPQRR